MDDAVRVECPWCGEPVELYVDPETVGDMIEDCEVCCRPWQLRIDRDGSGEPVVSLERA